EQPRLPDGGGVLIGELIAATGRDRRGEPPWRNPDEQVASRGDARPLALLRREIRAAGPEALLVLVLGRKIPVGGHPPVDELRLDPALAHLQADILGIDVQVRDAARMERFDTAQRLPEQFDAKTKIEERAEGRRVARVVSYPGPRLPEPRLDRPHGPPRARRQDPALALPPSQRIVQAQVQRLVEEGPGFE